MLIAVAIAFLFLVASAVMALRYPVRSPSGGSHRLLGDHWDVETMMQEARADDVASRQRSMAAWRLRRHLDSLPVPRGPCNDAYSIGRTLIALGLSEPDVDAMDGRDGVSMDWPDVGMVIGVEDGHIEVLCAWLNADEVPAFEDVVGCLGYVVDVMQAAGARAR